MQTNISILRAPDESARDYAYRALSTYIHEMVLRPGERIAENDIAEKLEISRTPVHDAFARLEREKMLRSVPRGALVEPLNVKNIRMNIWMYRTMCRAVLGELFNHRRGSLEELKEHLQKEQAALNSEDQHAMVQLARNFYSLVFQLANRDLVMQAMKHTSYDMYRLMYLLEDWEQWRAVASHHAALVQAIATHQYEASVQAVDADFDLFVPMLQEGIRRCPAFFEEFERS